MLRNSISVITEIIICLEYDMNKMNLFLLFAPKDFGLDFIKSFRQFYLYFTRSQQTSIN